MHPTPLFFQVPREILKNQLCEASYALGPDFLCFETFYQAVALTWPKDIAVIDIGGAFGIQGWLFADFRRYICVDSYDLLKVRDGYPVPRRCELPSNGIHVVSDGLEYLERFKGENVNTGDILFLCSAVPNEIVREATLEMPNSIVWYPGKPMRGNGEYAASTIGEFLELEGNGWLRRASDRVWKAVDGDQFWENQ